MGIRAKFNVKDAIRAIADRKPIVEELIIRNLAYAGEHAITVAREEHERNYTDRTGNLRGSTGYVVLKDGKVVLSGGFDPEAAENRTDGEKGAKEGRAFAGRLAADYPEGFVLIVVAGMYYGVYVERRDYNVITFTKIEAKKKADELMKGLFRTG
jgi:hypothetical protein